MSHLDGYSDADRQLIRDTARRLVNDAPPLTPEQVRKVRRIFLQAALEQVERSEQERTDP